ncbi:hypothetical protein ARMGADRAFT_1085779 [Armillaria gallica]|uniref:Uncharacterized protein n=1 Tax=Armillaria gallica TaxID=47427 RepID=A0A2H3DIU9_ARMGA|nr:hypothetical protein ARMGADRAFT_1085779 [Armillaria gallica]
MESITSTADAVLEEGASGVIRAISAAVMDGVHVLEDLAKRPPEDTVEGTCRVGHRGIPRRRGYEQQMESKRVRDRLRELTGGAWEESSIEQVVSDADFEIYEALWASSGHTHRPCTAQNFRVDLSRCCVRSNFNKGAAQVFADYFMTVEGIDLRDFGKRDRIIELFFGRLKRMRSKWLKQRGGDEAELGHRRQNIRAVRKNELYHRRRDVTYMVPQLKKHRELLDKIGTEGMSSDEEDGVSGDGTTIYKFQPPYWMSPNVENLLQWLDLIGAALKRSKQETRGRNPCIRRRNPPIPNDGKTPVAGLPRNVYRREWLASLSDVYREREIAPSSDICDLEIDPEIKTMVLDATRTL